MKPLRFVDLYRVIGSTPSPETLKHREKALSALPVSPTDEQWRQAIELAFGMQLNSDRVGWFVEPFLSDPSFSVVNNAREIAVLATCYLAKIAEFVGGRLRLSLDAAQLRGLRPPREGEALKLLTSAIGEVQEARLLSGIKEAKPKTVTPSLPDGQPVDAKSYNALSSVLSDSIQALRSETAAAVAGIVAQLKDNQRQTQSLAWLASGHCYALRVKWTEMKPMERAYWSSKEFSEFWAGTAGSVATSAILAATVRCNEEPPISVESAIVALSKILATREEQVPEGGFTSPLFGGVTASRAGRLSQYASEQHIDLNASLTILQVSEQLFLEQMGRSSQ